MALIGAYTKADYRQWCQEFTDFMTPRLEYFPDGLRWTIGNEINFDDGRTWQEYADQFVGWRDCIKALNPTFEVGTGALVQLNMRTRNIGEFVCVSYDDPESAETYFKNYINKIKTDYGNAKLPEFVVMHGYTPCDPSNTNPTAGSSPNWVSIDLFKQSVLEHRKVMKEVGLEDRDLIMKEFGPLNQAFYDAQGQLITDPEILDQKLQDYMQQSVDYLATTTNSTYGNPNDENRLVQKWAWYVMNKKVGVTTDFPHLALYETETKQIKPLGTKYKQLINYYVNQTPDPIQVETPAINPNGGTFTDQITITISTQTAGATITYTTDGSAPTTNSNEYTQPINITQTTTLKAIAFKAGMTNSNVATAVFTKETAQANSYNITTNLDFSYTTIPIIVQFLDSQNEIAFSNTYFASNKKLSININENQIDPGSYTMKVIPHFYTSLEKSVNLTQFGAMTVNLDGKFYGGNFSQTGSGNKVDLADLSLAISYFKHKDGSKDLDGDFKFGISDISIVVSSFKAGRN